jgi:hypothetical protein
MLPELGETTPVSRFSSFVLPAAFAPMSAATLPVGIEAEIVLRAWRRRYFFETSFNSIAVFMGELALLRW